MNIFVDFIVTYCSLYFAITRVIPHTNTTDATNFFKHKILIFVVVLGTEFIKRLLQNTENVSLSSIFKVSYHLSLIGLLGYTVFVDTTYMTETESLMATFNGSSTSRSMLIALFVTIPLIMTSLIYDIIED